MDEPSEDAPQDPVGDPFSERAARATADAGLFARLKQWVDPLPAPPDSPPLDRQEILKRLPEEMPPKVAGVLLEEAQTVAERRAQRVEQAEQKATTLLGTVAIAAGLVAAGAGFVLDPGKVADVWWRRALMLTVLALLVCLLVCGYLSSRVLIRIFKWSRPQTREALSRAHGTDAGTATLARAVDLLFHAGRNLYVADFKVDQLRVAWRWYRLAIAFLILLGVLLASYALFGEPPTKQV